MFHCLSICFRGGSGGPWSRRIKPPSLMRLALGSPRASQGAPPGSSGDPLRPLGWPWGLIGPMGPWAHGPMGPMGMGPWAHGPSDESLRCGGIAQLSNM